MRVKTGTHKVSAKDVSSELGSMDVNRKKKKKKRVKKYSETVV